MEFFFIVKLQGIEMKSRKIVLAMSDKSAHNGRIHLNASRGTDRERYRDMFCENTDQFGI